MLPIGENLWLTITLLVQSNGHACHYIVNVRHHALGVFPQAAMVSF